MSECCAKNESETLVFTCAGLDLMKGAGGALLCAAAVAADRPDKVDRARKAARRVIIDGCDDHCARRILESAGMPADVHVDLTTPGIEKKPETAHVLVDAKRVVEAVRERLRTWTGKRAMETRS